MAASTTRAMSSTQCATTPSLHALHNTPMKLLFVRVALGEAAVYLTQHEPGPGPVLQELIAKVQKAAGT